jgi:hypothetical protein
MTFEGVLTIAYTMVVLFFLACIFAYMLRVLRTAISNPMGMDREAIWGESKEAAARSVLMVIRIIFAVMLGNALSFAIGPVIPGIVAAAAFVWVVHRTLDSWGAPADPAVIDS